MIFESKTTPKAHAIFEKKHVLSESKTLDDIVSLYVNKPSLITIFDEMPLYRDYELFSILNNKSYYCLSKKRVNISFFRPDTKVLQRRYERMVVVFKRYGNDFLPIHINRIVFKDELDEFLKQNNL